MYTFENDKFAKEVRQQRQDDHQHRKKTEFLEQIDRSLLHTAKMNNRA